jgi:hypothetical protein
VKEALSPEAAANFLASPHISGHAVATALQEVSIAAAEAVSNMGQADTSAPPAAVVAAPAAALAKEAKGSKSKNAKGAAGKSPLKSGNTSVRMSVVSPAEEESPIDPNLAELIAIGEFPSIPDYPLFCPKLAEETAKQQKAFKKKGRVPATPKPDKDSRRPSMASQADGPTNNESDIESMAFMRFETIAAVYNRSRKLADRAATQLLVAPSPKTYVYNPALAEQQNPGRHNPNNSLPPVAADGRVGMVGSVIAPSPWLLEARQAVVRATATSLAQLDRYLPADTSAVLEDLFNKGRPVLDEFGVANVPEVEKEESASSDPEIKAAMYDLAGLLPCSILDEVITRAVLREASRTHTVKAAKVIVPNVEAEGEEGAADDKAAGKGGKDEKAKEKAKKPPPEKGKKGTKKDKGKESEEALFPYPVPPAPRLLAPPIPSKGPTSSNKDKETGEIEEGDKVDDGGGADLMRWRYIIYESVRSLIQDDILFLRQWSARRLQRHLAPKFPFTQLPDKQLQHALDLCGGHVLKAAKLMTASHKVSSSCWVDGGGPLNKMLATISGGDKDSRAVQLRSLRSTSDDPEDSLAATGTSDGGGGPQPLEGETGTETGGGGGSFDMQIADEEVPPSAPPPSSSSSTRNLVPKTPKTPSSSASHRHRPHHHEFDWSMDELLQAADRGIAFITANRLTSSPFRNFCDDFLERAAWLSKVTGLNISDHEVMNTLLESSAGMKTKCLLPEPLNPEVEKQKEAERELAANSPAARLMRRDESAKTSSDSSPFNLPTDDSKGHTQESAIKSAKLHIHPAVAFERLYSLPQVLACTAISTRGLISYQRKLDLARILSMSDLLSASMPSSSQHHHNNHGNNGNVPTNPFSESYECTVDRLGWWCIGASPSIPSLVRGRIVFGVGLLELLGLDGHQHENMRGSLSTHSTHSTQSTVSNASPKHRSSTPTSTSFFTNSRKFFDPSLAVPLPYVDQALMARANQLAEALNIVSIVNVESNQNKTSEWVSPSATVGVVDAGLEGMILGFQCSAVAGTEVYLDVCLQTQPKKNQKVRFGPYKISLSGGEVNVGELLFPHPPP